MSKNNEYISKVVLSIAGADISPDLISERIKIIPTSVGNKGIPKSKQTQPAKQNVWSWYSDEESDGEQIEAQLRKLMLVFSDKKFVLKELSNNTKISVCVIIEAIKYYPGIVLSPELITFCADIGAGLEIDSYVALADALPEGNSGHQPRPK
jgi:hypothetical protein